MPVYATSSDLTNRYDMRRISQFISDTGSPVCTQAQINSGACAVILSTNTILSSLLKDASNKVLMACRVANRYLQSDLDLIYADPDRSESLIRLVCDLTFGYIMMRRGLAMNEVYDEAPGFKDALQTLEMLKDGGRVFDDSTPDGTDAPNAGDTVDVLPVGAIIVGNNGLWNQQVRRILPQGPGPGNGFYCQ